MNLIKFQLKLLESPLQRIPQVCNGGGPFHRAGELGSSATAKKRQHMNLGDNSVCGKRPNKPFQCMYKTFKSISLEYHIAVCFGTWKDKIDQEQNKKIAQLCNALSRTNALSSGHRSLR